MFISVYIQQKNYSVRGDTEEEVEEKEGEKEKKTQWEKFDYLFQWLIFNSDSVTRDKLLRFRS